MNILLDRFPTEVVFDDVIYPINPDFRVMLLFEEVMRDTELEAQDRIEIVLRHLFPHSTPPDLQEAVDFLLWFYRLGKEPAKRKSQDGVDAPRQPKIYSYEHDAPYIYAAFLDQYSIDLNEESIHWFKFRALFDSLREDHKFSKILGYRQMKLTDELTKSQKAFYIDMKRLYALPDERTEEEKEQDFAEELGDLIG